MKTLIWLLCIFAFSLIRMLIKDAGIILGAIPTCLLYLLACWCAKRLCQAWSKHKERKERDHTPSAFSEVSVSADQSTPVSHKYCKLCGGTVDPRTNQCTVCYKQYARKQVARKPLVIVIVVAAVLAALNVYQYIQYQSVVSSLQTQTNELKADIETLSISDEQNKKEAEEYRQQALEYSIEIKNLEGKIEQLEDEIDFYDRHVVFIPDDGSKVYHSYGCSYFDSEHFMVAGINSAKKIGFSPCPYCCE